MWERGFPAKRLRLARTQNHLRRNVAQNLFLQLQIKLRIQLLHPFGQQRGQPWVILGARHLNAHVALIIHHIGGDGIQLTTKLAHIGEVQCDRGAFSRRVDDFGLRLGFGSLERRFGFIQFRLAGMDNGAVDATG